ncbi:hypothetical protein [Variovorax guangxiensis]|nr:hypothetical protein [Variovorax guangxiensis]
MNKKKIDALNRIAHSQSAIACCAFGVLQCSQRIFEIENSSQREKYVAG